MTSLHLLLLALFTNFNEPFTCMMITPCHCTLYFCFSELLVSHCFADFTSTTPEDVRSLGRGECSRSATRTGAYNAKRSEEYVDGSMWQPQDSHFYFYFVGKCDVLAKGLHGSSNLY